MVVARRRIIHQRTADAGACVVAGRVSIAQSGAGPVSQAWTSPSCRSTGEPRSA